MDGTTAAVTAATYRFDVEKDGGFGDEYGLLGLLVLVRLHPLCLEALCLFILLIIAEQVNVIIVVVLLLLLNLDLLGWLDNHGLLKASIKGRE